MSEYELNGDVYVASLIYRLKQGEDVSGVESTVRDMTNSLSELERLESRKRKWEIYVSGPRRLMTLISSPRRYSRISTLVRRLEDRITVNTDMFK